MARFYSGSHGKSGSKKPMIEKSQEWIRYSPEETELLVVKLSREGNLSSKIGKILRDTYGIPSVKKITGKKVVQVLVDHKIEVKIPDDLRSLLSRALALRNHLEKNKNDQSANRGLNLTEAKINKLLKYYKRTEKIADDWKYDPSKLKVILG